MISSSNYPLDHMSLLKILKIRPFTIPIGEKVAENWVKLFSVKFLKVVEKNLLFKICIK